MTNNNTLRITLNTPVAVDGIITEVTRSAGSGRYSLIVVGGTPAEKREAAESFFSLIGRELGEAYAVSRPYGDGLLYGEAIRRR